MSATACDRLRSQSKRPTGGFFCFVFNQLYLTCYLGVIPNRGYPSQACHSNDSPPATSVIRGVAANRLSQPTHTNMQPLLQNFLLSYLCAGRTIMPPRPLLTALQSALFCSFSAPPTCATASACASSPLCPSIT